MRPQRRLGGGWWLTAPEIVDEPIAREDLAGVEDENGEQGALLPASEREGFTALDDLERTEYAELHASMVRGVQRSCNSAAIRARHLRVVTEPKEDLHVLDDQNRSARTRGRRSARHSSWGGGSPG